MILTQTQRSTLGLILFLLGLGLSAGLALGTLWANFEASQFDSGIRAQANFEGLQCPTLLTRAEEEASIQITLENPLDRENDRPVRVTITEGSVLYLRTSIERIVIPALGSTTVAFPIYPWDAAWGRFVLARIYAFSDHPFPTQAATCGVWVIPIRWATGNQLLALWLVGIVILQAGGAGLWYRANRPLRNTPLYFAQAMAALAVLGAAAATFGVLGAWLPAGLLMLVFLLASLTILNRFWE